MVFEARGRNYGEVVDAPGGEQKKINTCGKIAVKEVGRKGRGVGRSLYARTTQV